MFKGVNNFLISKKYDFLDNLVPGNWGKIIFVIIEMN